MNIVKFLEEKHGAVCDHYSVENGNINMTLRVVRHDFEYATKLVACMETGMIFSYNFLWEWHRKPQKAERIVQQPLKQTISDAPKPTPVIRRPVRRSVLELNKQAEMA